MVLTAVCSNLVENPVATGAAAHNITRGQRVGNAAAACGERERSEGRERERKEALVSAELQPKRASEGSE